MNPLTFTNSVGKYIQDHGVGKDFLNKTQNHQMKKKLIG